MKNILKKISLALAVLASSLGLVLTPMALQGVSAQDAIQNQLCSGVQKATGSNNSCGNTDNVGTGKLDGIITAVINIFSIVVGVVSVIMIIIGGLKYITSGGDSNKVTSAKNTILYAVIGLIIVALAQFIVRYVLTKIG